MRGMLLVAQPDLIGGDVLGSELVGRPLEVTREVWGIRQYVITRYAASYRHYEVAFRLVTLADR